jgi:hypothetical protein
MNVFIGFIVRDFNSDGHLVGLILGLLVRFPGHNKLYQLTCTGLLFLFYSGSIWVFFNFRKPIDIIH